MSGRIIGSTGGSVVYDEAKASTQAKRIPSIAITLAQDTVSRTRWLVQVDAQIDELATVRVGTFLSKPPSAFEGLPAENAQILVKRGVVASPALAAIASLAGATGWKVFARPAYDLVPTSTSAHEPITGTPILSVSLSASNIPYVCDGLQVVNADGRHDEIVEQEAFEVDLDVGVPTLLVPFDQHRALVRVAQATGVTLALGQFLLGPSANETFFPLIDVYESRSRLPLWATAAVATTAAVYVDRY